MSHVIVPPPVTPQSLQKYERMIGILRAAIPDEAGLADFLTRMERTDPNPKKRELARALIRYVLDHRYLVHPHV